MHFDFDPTHTAFCRRMRTALALHHVSKAVLPDTVRIGRQVGETGWDSQQAGQAGVEGRELLAGSGGLQGAVAGRACWQARG